MIRRVWWYVAHRLRAKNIHRIHSPFVFDLISNILPHQPSLMGLRFEQLRKNLKPAQQQVCFEDLGAGFGGKESKMTCKPLGYLVRRSARTRPEGELLYRLARFQQPKRCLELGTHLGFSGLYQMAGLEKDARFITIEGAQEVAEIARSHFNHFGYQPEQHIGDFSEVLSLLDLETYKPDWVLLDGNHRYEATLSYARMILPHMPAGSIMILDDIYWSEGMRRAWVELAAEPRVSVSLDLFHLGLLFIERNQAKEHFRLPPFYIIFTP
jgi:predicted O-methyltransferase YrrM